MHSVDHKTFISLNFIVDRATVCSLWEPVRRQHKYKRQPCSRWHKYAGPAKQQRAENRSRRSARLRER